jgi:outer membrane receptor for ferrienterochelin and colicin
MKRTPVAQAISLVLGTTLLVPAIAQDATSGAEDVGEIVVTGIRASLESSMNLKRSGQGVVDGIIAEDIGKFPDTNLAESLQRISGVSINRTASGEGQQITVRGVGPDFNLILLNGRQMPASNSARAAAARRTRAPTIFPTSRRTRSRPSRCTRPLARERPPAASVRR